MKILKDFFNPVQQRVDTKETLENNEKVTGMGSPSTHFCASGKGVRKAMEKKLARTKRGDRAPCRLRLEQEGQEKRESSLILIKNTERKKEEGQGRVTRDKGDRRGEEGSVLYRRPPSRNTETGFLVTRRKAKPPTVLSAGRE